jgi:hypothetical protein
MLDGQTPGAGSKAARRLRFKDIVRSHGDVLGNRLLQAMVVQLVVDSASGSLCRVQVAQERAGKGEPDRSDFGTDVGSYCALVRDTHWDWDEVRTDSLRAGEIARN